MKKSMIFLFIAGLVALASAFQANEKTPSERIQIRYAEGIAAFSDAIDVYLAAQEAGKSSEEILVLHKNCRLAYKKIEYLLAYYDEQLVKQFINGAPLLGILHKPDKLEILEPEGLQVLDELVVEEGNETTIIAKLKVLQKAVAEFQDFEGKRRLTDPRILEAMRLQLVRIMSLGITGFDTPGTINGLEEALISLESLQLHFQQYNDYYGKLPSYQATDALFTNNIQYLTKNSTTAAFDSFDRLEFIREFINPLHEKLLDFHLAAGVEVFGEARLLNNPVNYQAKNPFSKDYFNPYAFIYLQPKQNNAKMEELGSYLFFDPFLSVNNKMSCATCHQPSLAFTDGLPKSITNAGTPNLRNSPTLANAVFSKRHFYDLRADKLENQVKDVVHNPAEFHTDFAAISEKLQQSKEYQALFEEAFEYATWSKTKIDDYTITTAITAFLKNIQSLDSPFDRYMRKETEELDSMVALGFNLFMGKAACGTCHFAPLFHGLVPPSFHENESEVLGVPADKATTKLDSDIGRHTNKRAHEAADHLRHSFKTVTVRNAALTAPYMHNGVFETLEEVVDFYNNGGGAGQGLDVPFQTLAADSLGLTEIEQGALVAFMEALTDTSFVDLVPERLPDFPEERERVLMFNY